MLPLFIFISFFYIWNKLYLTYICFYFSKRYFYQFYFKFILIIIICNLGCISSFIFKYKILNAKMSSTQSIVFCLFLRPNDYDISQKSCSDLHFDCILLPATARNVRTVLKHYDNHTHFHKCTATTTKNAKQ